MTDLPFLPELAVVAGASVLVTVAIGRLRLPAVTGLLLAGALVGPFGLGLVRDVHTIQTLAEVGVVILLFTIGLEFSLSQLLGVFRRAALGGLLQVALTITAVLVAAVPLGFLPGKALLYSFVFALSSTALMLRMLTTRGELSAPHGRFIVATLLFQDLCIIPMVLVVPILARGTGSPSELVYPLGMAVVVVVGVLAASRVVVPRLLDLVDASRSREAFLLAVLGICVGTAWLTSLAGVSLALGAFLGGMMVADTEYRHRAMGDMLPLRDVLVSYFFVSLGMLWNFEVVSAHPAEVAGLLAGFILVKGLLATAAAIFMRFPPRAAWLAGVGLAQFGEFGFVLVRLGVAEGLVTAAEVAPLLQAGILSMVLTPLMVQQAPFIRAGERVLAPLARLLGASNSDEVLDEVETDGHVVVVGYGVAGRLLARSLQRQDAEYVVLEMNIENVRTGRARGHQVIYGDATSVEVLRHVGLESARAVVVVINDPRAAIRIVDTVRQVSSQAIIFLRTRYLADCDELLQVGASDVVAEEVEGAAEILARVLRELGAPRNVIDKEVEAAREETQETARTALHPHRHLTTDRILSDLKVDSVLVRPGSSGASRSAKELELRQATGASLVAIRRGEQVQANPSADERIEVGDVLYLIGSGDAVRKAVELFDLPETPD